jgi:hypothetical protein
MESFRDSYFVIGSPGIQRPPVTPRCRSAKSLTPTNRTPAAAEPEHPTFTESPLVHPTCAYSTQFPALTLVRPKVTPSVLGFEEAQHPRIDPFAAPSLGAVLIVALSLTIKPEPLRITLLEECRVDWTPAVSAPRTEEIFCYLCSIARGRSYQPPIEEPS